MRERRPNLVVTLPEPVSAGVASAPFYIENQGHETLDSVLVLRPRTVDGVRYPVAKMGADFADSAEVGPLEVRQKVALMLAIGSSESLPEFRLVIRCRIGRDSWEVAHVLDDPRFHIGIY